MAASGVNVWAVLAKVYQDQRDSGQSGRSNNNHITTDTNQNNVGEPDQESLEELQKEIEQHLAGGEVVDQTPTEIPTADNTSSEPVTIPPLERLWLNWTRTYAQKPVEPTAENAVRIVEDTEQTVHENEASAAADSDWLDENQKEFWEEFAHRFGGSGALASNAATSGAPPVAGPSRQPPTSLEDFVKIIEDIKQHQQRTESEKSMNLNEWVAFKVEGGMPRPTSVSLFPPPPNNSLSNTDLSITEQPDQHPTPASISPNATHSGTSAPTSADTATVPTETTSAESDEEWEDWVKSDAPLSPSIASATTNAPAQHSLATAEPSTLTTPDRTAPLSLPPLDLPTLYSPAGTPPVSDPLRTSSTHSPPPSTNAQFFPVFVPPTITPLSDTASSSTPPTENAETNNQLPSAEAPVALQQKIPRIITPTRSPEEIEEEKKRQEAARGEILSRIVDQMFSEQPSEKREASASEPIPLKAASNTSTPASLDQNETAHNEVDEESTSTAASTTYREETWLAIVAEAQRLQALEASRKKEEEVRLELCRLTTLRQWLIAEEHREAAAEEARRRTNSRAAASEDIEFWLNLKLVDTAKGRTANGAELAAVLPLEQAAAVEGKEAWEIELERNFERWKRNFANLEDSESEDDLDEATAAAAAKGLVDQDAVHIPREVRLGSQRLLSGEARDFRRNTDDEVLHEEGPHAALPPLVDVLLGKPPAGGTARDVHLATQDDEERRGLVGRRTARPRTWWDALEYVQNATMDAVKRTAAVVGDYLFEEDLTESGWRSMVFRGTRPFVRNNATTLTSTTTATTTTATTTTTTTSVESLILL